MKTILIIISIMTYLIICRAIVDQLIDNDIIDNDYDDMAPIVFYTIILPLILIWVVIDKIGTWINSKF